ncbi:MAG TPA: membrane dipeptidase, partial [Solirubrobacterales bacterium]
SFDAELEAELQRRWRRSPDALRVSLAAMARPAELAAEGRYPAYEEVWRESGVTAGTRQIELAELDLALSTLGALRAQCDRLPWLEQARTAEDIRAAKRAGGHAAFGSTQLIAGPGADLIGAVPDAQALGLRMLQLTYNTMTVVGSGCAEPRDPGLSAYGARLVGALNEAGVIVDTGHCGHRTTLDACEVSEAPVVASHCGAKALYEHVRTKTDEELEAIAATGGVIGVVVVPFFLSSDPGADMHVFLDHLEHIVRRVGVEHVAVGTDWPYPLPKSMLDECVGSFAEEGGFEQGAVASPTQNLVGFDDYRDFPNVTRGLVQRGFDDVEILALLGENALRVFEQVWK